MNRAAFPLLAFLLVACNSGNGAGYPGMAPTVNTANPVNFPALCTADERFSVRIESESSGFQTTLSDSALQPPHDSVVYDSSLEINQDSWHFIAANFDLRIDAKADTSGTHPGVLTALAPDGSQLADLPVHCE